MTPQPQKTGSSGVLMSCAKSRSRGGIDAADWSARSGTTRTRTVRQRGRPGSRQMEIIGVKDGIAENESTKSVKGWNRQDV
jgi:hypothetical protein